MQSISVICIGKLKDAFFEDAAAEYLKRLRAYAKTEVIEIKAVTLPEEPSPAQIQSALEKEGAEILKKIPSGAAAVALCIEGKLYSSEDMAELITDNANRGDGKLVFIIGGSYGLSENVKAACKIRLSMSKMTFPHRLARIMLLEQIYRGFKIISGEKYHK